MVKMIDISDKKTVLREAIAAGRIVLKPGTIKIIKSGRVNKGDPLTVARIAAIDAVKNTSNIIPLCHQIPITAVAFEFKLGENDIAAQVKVKAWAQTGVEMEAIVGICTVLFTIWDMVKYLEKDKKGQYPVTRIDEIRVLKKRKYG